MKSRKCLSLFVTMLAACLLSCRTTKNKTDNASVTLKPEVFQSAIPKPFDLLPLDRKASEAHYAELRRRLIPAPTSFVEPEGLYQLIRSARLAGRPTSELNSLAQRLMSLKPDPKSSRWVSLAILELTRDAISQQKLDLADYYLSKVDKDKTSAIVSEILMAKGIICYLRNDFDEALRLWSESVKTDESNKSARINLGFLQLRTGNASAVTRTLEPIKDHWLALSGLVVAYRLNNQTKLAQEACQILRENRAIYEPGLINCALFFAQNRRDSTNAMALLDQVVKSGRRPDVSEYAFLLRNEIALDAQKQPSPAEISEDKDKKD